jgi:serine/threonine protein kinase/tetratricopeptide (TPR) repeat protein
MKGDEDRVAALLAEWCDRVERGDAADPDDLVAAHPDLAVELRRGLRSLEYVDAALGKHRDAVPELPARIGSYRIRDLLGAGGMGTVFLAEAGTDAGAVPEAMSVALKVIHPHLLRTPGFFKRFLREAEFGRRVTHPNVVRTLDADALESDGRAWHFLVMEYVEGQTLRDLIDELGTVPEELCRHVGRQVAEALAAIHQAGLLHRDVKPENVLITPENDVKVMDLGIARAVDELVRLSQTGAFVGSVLYAAPEQFQEALGTVDHRADLHALGLLLYEMACGRHPFQADDVPAVLGRILHEDPAPLGAVNEQLSPFFEGLVHTLLAKSPEARFQRAVDVVSALRGGERGAWWVERSATAARPGRRSLRRIRVPRETALYGRDEELARFDGWWRSAASGDGRVVLVDGEAGIGKSRLVDELVARLDAEGAEVAFLHGSYPPGGAATAVGALTEAVREHFGASSCAHCLRQVPLLAPAFDALLRGEPPPPGTPALTPDSLGTCFAEVIRALSEQRPVIVAVEDLHFAPDDGRALFARLAMEARDRRVLLIGTTRPGLPAAWLAELERLEHAERMPLARIGPKDLFGLMCECFGSERLADELGLRIAVKSDGNPYFLFEIVRDLREGGHLVQGPDGSWATTGAIEHIRVPSSVQDLVLARTAGLEDDDRDLLDLAACCGFEFDAATVASAAGLPVVACLKRLARIERRYRLLAAVGRRFRFDHHQVHEALYDALSEPLREAYHVAIAEALERHERDEGREAADVTGDAAVALCEHFLQGAVGARARPYLAAALDRLHRYGARGRAAVALADRALDVPGLLTGTERATVLLRTCDMLALGGAAEERTKRAEEGLALARAAGDDALIASFLREHAMICELLGRFDDARARLERALPHAEACGDEIRHAAVLGMLGSIAWHQDDLDTARGYHLRMLEITERIGDERGQAVATGNLANTYVDRGDYDEAGRLMERYVEIATSAGDRVLMATALGNLSMVRKFQGDTDAARELLGRALDVSRSVGDRIREVYSLDKLGMLDLETGRYESALSNHERELALARSMGMRSHEVSARNGLGNVYDALGRAGAALSCHEENARTAEQLGQPAQVAVALVNAGPARAGLGDTETALQHLDRAAEICIDIANRRVLGYAHHGRGRVLEQEGRLAEALLAYRAAVVVRSELGTPGPLSSSLLGSGRVLARKGDVEGAREAFAASQRLAAGVDDPGLAAQIEAQRAALPGGDASVVERLLEEHRDRIGRPETMGLELALWRLTGDAERLRAARRILQELVAAVEPEWRTSMLERVPENREIERAWRAMHADA